MCAVITISRYNEIYLEIEEGVNTVFEQIKNHSLSNYILMLANGEYVEILMQAPNLSPYEIEFTLDRYTDQNRLMFLANFLNEHYRFMESDTIRPDENRLHIELMIYTHIWESKPFLKIMYRLAFTYDGKIYPWKVSIPDTGKHDFIRKDIIKVLEENSNILSGIIKKGFHSSLRNAFAHSEYNYNFKLKDTVINLNNYKGRSWELKYITLEDWTERFVYSALLSYVLYDNIRSRRRNLVKEFNTNIFEIDRPSRDGLSVNKVKIVYNKENDEFKFDK